MVQKVRSIVGIRQSAQIDDGMVQVVADSPNIECCDSGFSRGVLFEPLSDAPMSIVDVGDTVDRNNVPGPQGCSTRHNQRRSRNSRSNLMLPCSASDQVLHAEEHRWEKQKQA